MPSVFTHLAVGSSLAAALPRQQRTLAVGASLAFLAASPDLDVIAFGMGIPYGHPLGHRGFTHSLPFALGVALASIPLWRRLLADSPASVPLLAAGLSFVALASHGILDAFTDAGKGIGLLIPFDNQRYFAPWRPILTSPVEVERFFTRRGLTILRNEAVWIGIPTALFLLAIVGLRRMGVIR